MIYKITLISNNFSHDFEESPITHKFLNNHVIKAFKYYKSKSDSNVYLYQFMNQLSFLVVEAENKVEVDKKIISGIKSQYDKSPLSYYCHSGENYEMSDFAISKILRGSGTLKINELNCCYSSYFKAIFSETACLLLINTTKDELQEHFERLLLQFILMLSYNLYSEYLIDKVSSSFEDNKPKNMITIRNNFLHYNLTVFYANPVKRYTQMPFQMWECMSNFYHVERIHCEVKSKVNDLINVIDNQGNNFRQYIIGIFGVIIALASLVFAFK